MKQIWNLKTFMLMILLSSTVSLVSSCSDDDNSKPIEYGTVNGTVTDEAGHPVAGVTVAISDVEEPVITGNDGKYAFLDVTMEIHAVTFTKNGYLTTTATIAANKFDNNKVAAIHVTMVNADAKIKGTVIDANNGDRPLSGVTVSTNNQSVTTGNDGQFVFENLITGDYTLTLSKVNYGEVVRQVSKSDFINGVATLANIRMGGTEILRGLTIDDLRISDKWHYNEYRGGGNADAYPHWDWACNYMCTLTFNGNWEEQWEGTTLRIRNESADQKNPANLNVFDSYTYGSKLITQDNKMMSLRVRTHSADQNAPAHFGVQVIDLSETEPVAVKIGENKTYGSGDYTDFHFDLSAYVGKEVVIAIGLYRAQTGDYWKQLVLRAIRFASVDVVNWNWLPGTEVLSGWKLTQEMVRSTMPLQKKAFTGTNGAIVPGRNVSMTDGYPAAYRLWREKNHIAANWSFMPLQKDPEVDKTEGYIIKTRGNGAIDTQTPEAYLYAKFAIAEGNNNLTLKTRNFSGDYTFFKLTAITEDCTVKHIEPVSNTAQSAAAAADGCWKFKHESGGSGDPEGYASFIYDLSEFNGKQVVLAFGVYNGELNGTENKLTFYSINLK